MRSHKTLPLTALTLAVTALLALLPAGASAQVQDHEKLKFPPMRSFTVPQPERITLPNGMLVLLLEDHELPLIEAGARIRTGSRLDPVDKVGLSEIFGAVLRTGGTTSMTGDQIDDFLEARAAVVETGASEDSTFATVSCLKQDFPDVVKVFSDILRNPVFSEDKIKIAKNSANAGIARRNDNPQGIMFREFDKLVYGAGSPYGRTTEYATIESISRDDLVAFHKKYLHPNRVILGLTGDFNAKEMASKIKATFGDWPKAPETKDPVATYQTSTKSGVYYIQKEDMTQSDIIMGHLGIQRDNPDFFAVEVLNEVLGGSFASRLFSNVRSKKGLAYSVRGSVGSNYDYPGTFTAWMTTKTETTAAGMDALLVEIDAIVAKPPTDQEVQLAKDSILNSFVFNFDSKMKILNQQITYAYFGYPSDFLARYRENIEKVTPVDVARVAKKYIHKDQMAILVVGPSKGQDRPLDSFGKVATVDITIPEAKGPAAPAASAQSLTKGKALFAKMVGALGGPAAVDAVKSIRIVGTDTRKGPQGEFSTKAVSTVSIPDRLHQEMTTPMGKMVMVMAGADGFVNTPQGTQPLPESQRAEVVRSLRRQPIALAQRRDDGEMKLQHLGEESIDGTKVENLLVTIAGDELRLSIDPATGRILRQAYRGQDQMGPADYVVSFSDFRQVSGLTLPFKSARTRNGEPHQSMVVEEIVINPNVDAAMFAQPESPTASKEPK